MAAVIWVKALKTDLCFGSLSEENSLMWPIIVSAILRPLSKALSRKDTGKDFMFLRVARRMG